VCGRFLDGNMVDYTFDPAKFPSWISQPHLAGIGEDTDDVDTETLDSGEELDDRDDVDPDVLDSCEELDTSSSPASPRTPRFSSSSSSFSLASSSSSSSSASASPSSSSSSASPRTPRSSSSSSAAPRTPRPHSSSSSSSSSTAFSSSSSAGRQPAVQRFKGKDLTANFFGSKEAASELLRGHRTELDLTGTSADDTLCDSAVTSAPPKICTACSRETLSFHVCVVCKCQLESRIVCTKKRRIVIKDDKYYCETCAPEEDEPLVGLLVAMDDDVDADLHQDVSAFVSVKSSFGNDADEFAVPRLVTRRSLRSNSSVP
jgi:hypothetical protein